MEVCVGTDVVGAVVAKHVSEGRKGACLAVGGLCLWLIVLVWRNPHLIM